jgi:FAD/FMN-containing dehydrogenase
MSMETIRLADWSGFTNYGGSREVYAPANEKQVMSLVRRCLEQKKKLRVVGLQTAWNTLWYCEDVMMTTRRLNAIKSIDTAARTITCEPGATLHDIHQVLWDKGLTLIGSPAIDWVTVAGAVSTGSHGSGAASLSSKLVECRLVTGTGETLEIGETHDALDAVRISLGLLGIFTALTLRAVDAFFVTVNQTRIPTREWRRFLTEGDMSYLLWFPHTEDSVLVTAKVLEQAPAASAPVAESRPGIDMAEVGRAVRKLANYLPWTFPARNRYLLDVFFRDYERTGPAHEMLMSFTSEPIAGSEWALPVSRFEAAFAEVQQMVANGQIYVPMVWLKKVEPDTAWLTAADEPSVQCGIYHDVLPDSPWHAAEMVSTMEQLMLRYGGRPHLGKLIYMKPADLKRIYPHWAKFDALRRRLDPHSVFWSPAIAARFGDAV